MKRTDPTFRAALTRVTEAKKEKQRADAEYRAALRALRQVVADGTVTEGFGWQVDREGTRVDVRRVD